MYQFREFYIPTRMLGGLERHISDGVPVGDFLYGILTNDLMKVFYHADPENMKNIPAYVAYLVNIAPVDSYGSTEKVTAWVKLKRKERKEAKDE